MDGTSRKKGVGVSLQLKAPIGERIEHAIQLDFPTSNNEVNPSRYRSHNLLILKKDHHTK